MPYVGKLEDQEQYEEFDKIIEDLEELRRKYTKEDGDNAVFAHSCLHFSFVIFSLSEVIHQQAMTVCTALADKFLKRAN